MIRDILDDYRVIRRSVLYWALYEAWFAIDAVFSREVISTQDNIALAAVLALVTTAIGFYTYGRFWEEGNKG